MKKREAGMLGSFSCKRFVRLHHVNKLCQLLIIVARITALVNIVSVACDGLPCVTVSSHVRLKSCDSYSME